MTYCLLARLSVIALAACPLAGHAATLAATYDFNDTLNATGGPAPALVATDPLSVNGFEDSVVFGQNRRVYHFDGTDDPSTLNSGLTFDSTGIISSTDYSIELVFEFLEREDQWRRIVDVENRESDNGFYVDPNNALALFPVTGSPQSFSLNEYHHVVFTNSTGVVNAYLDGSFQFTANSNLMDIANPNNPGNLVHLFLDNMLGGGLGEFSDGRIALARFYDGALTAPEVTTLAQDPFANIPEPATGLLAALGSLALLRFRKVAR